jgi:hypothetical protein
MTMRKRLPIAAVAAALAAASAAPAFAAIGDNPHGTVVSTASVAPGSRQLQVLDMTGNDLTNLSLKPGVPQAFRVSVVDNQLASLVKQGFTVSTVMNNLYQDNNGTPDYTKKIPSSDVNLGLSSDPLSALGVSVTNTPLVGITGQIDTCSNLEGLLTGVLSQPLALASPLLCGVGGVLLNGLNLDSVLQGAGIASPLTVGGTVTKTASNLFDELSLPFDLNSICYAGGKFTEANFANGIGQGDTQGALAAASGQATGDVGTSYTVLKGVPAVPAGLLSQFGLPAQGTALTQLASVTAIETALYNTGVSTLQTLVKGLQALDSAPQATILDDLTGTLSSTVATLSNETGVYNSFPNLQVDPSAAPAPGTYSGTLTITMVQQ